MELYCNPYNFSTTSMHNQGDTLVVSTYQQNTQQTTALNCVVKYITKQRVIPKQKELHNKEVTNILERITDGFLALDNEWNITYWNNEAERIMGTPREEVLWINLWACYPELVGTHVFKQYYKSFGEQTPVHFEFYNEQLETWYDINAYPSKEGLSIFFKNINDRKNGEEEISKLSFIVKQTDNLVILCDPEGKIKWINDAFIQRTGYTLQEVSGKRPGDLLGGPETDQKAIERARVQYRNGKPFQEELLYYTKSKEKFWVEVTGQPIFDAKGNIKELFSIQTDVTERKRLQDQLIEEREIRQRKITAAVIQAQETERAQVGRELHDNVNQVLTTVKLYNELCRDGFGNTTEIMDKSIKLLQASIEEIRSLSKRLSGLSLNDIKFKDSIKELIDSVSATKKTFITLDTVKVDILEVNQEVHLAIYRILQEHLTNIIKHAEAQSVRVVFDHIDGELILKVVDDGKGFDLNQKRSGIGITNMMTRAESLNGSLTINSAPGLGCIFIARFPLNKS